jgi:hypothetical protein
MSRVTPDSRLAVPADVVYRDVLGEAMILHLGTGTYFGLDPVGSRIWQLITERSDIASVWTAMAEEFDAPVEKIRADVLALVEKLVDKQLLDVVP